MDMDMDRNQVSVDLTNRLSTLLDAARNEQITSELGLLPTDPREVLSRVLSSSVTSTPSSSASLNTAQQTTSVGFRSIGFGQCGLIFERPGCTYAIKIARPSFENALWADFQAHFAAYQAFTNHQSEFVELARQALIDAYCPVPSRLAVMSHDTNRDCLARIYLGRRRDANDPPARNFTLRNFNLCLDQMIELDLPIQHYARAIGQALAIMHWSANVDGYDVEFVLGSERETTYTQDICRSLGLSAEQIAKMPPHTDLDSMIRAKSQRRISRIWVLDFNLCSIWEERMGLERPDDLIAHLVEAFFENDPYCPRPSQDSEPEKALWFTFSESYRDTAAKLQSFLMLAYCDNRKIQPKVSTSLPYGLEDNGFLYLTYNYGSEALSRTMHASDVLPQRSQAAKAAPRKMSHLLGERSTTP
ncbi:unnamed protein product [Penicillium discolor]